MCAHREPHGVLPAGIFPHFIVRHAECRLPFFTALFHCPPDTAEPDQRAERRTGRRMTDRGGLGRLGAAGPLAHSPDGALWQPGLPSGHALTRKVIRHRPRGPFRACPPLPRPRWQGRGQRCDALRGKSRRPPLARRSRCACIPGGLLLRCRPLRPAARLRGESHQGRGAHAGLKRRQTIGALAVHPSSDDVPAGQ
jgi:hypothetical protein